MHKRDEALGDLLIEEAISQLDDEQREHFNSVLRFILTCYHDPKHHGLFLIGRDDAEREGDIELAQILSINTTDINAVQIMAAGQPQIGMLVMSDAPPRELFN